MKDQSIPKTPIIYDCFTYDGEDCLELRLLTHWDEVDHFVIVEGAITFSGQPKALSFDLSKYEWAKEKITYISLTEDDFYGCTTAWDREHYQRNALTQGYIDARDEDIIIISDVDEIYKPETLKNIKKLFSTTNNFKWMSLEVLMFYFYCDYLMISDPFWLKPIAALGVFAKQYTPEQLRNDKKLRKIHPPTLYAESGWHFSYLGGTKMLLTKLERFSHQNLNKSKFKNEKRNLKRIYNGKDIYQRAKKWGRINFKDNLPPQVKLWFEQRPWLFTPEEVVYAGDLNSIIKKQREMKILIKKLNKLWLRIWNVF